MLFMVVCGAFVSLSSLFLNKTGIPAVDAIIEIFNPTLPIYVPVLASLAMPLACTIE
jgi:hypothetical protein